MARHPQVKEGFRDPVNEDVTTFQPGDKAYFTIVASIGEIDDWAAYKGFGTPEEVARTGDKLGEEEASRLFPRLAAQFRYRK